MVAGAKYLEFACFGSLRQLAAEVIMCTIIPADGCEVSLHAILGCPGLQCVLIRHHYCYEYALKAVAVHPDLLHQRALLVHCLHLFDCNVFPCIRGRTALGNLANRQVLVTIQLFIHTTSISSTITGSLAYAVAL